MDELTIICSDVAAQAYQEGMTEGKRLYEHKWISVKDRLPEEGNRYWVYIQELNDGGWFSYFQWNCYYDPQEKVFRDAGKTHKVTHWTNLLPPPQ